MPRGDKSAYTEKQKRKAAHIERSYEQRGLGEGEAERRAWATVNKQDGGGRRSGSARRKAPKASSRSRKEGASRPRKRAAASRRKAAGRRRSTGQRRGRSVAGR